MFSAKQLNSRSRSPIEKNLYKNGIKHIKMVLFWLQNLYNVHVT